MRYAVMLSRWVPQYAEVIVEASSEDEARRIAAQRTPTEAECQEPGDEPGISSAWRPAQLVELDGPTPLETGTGHHRRAAA